VSQQSYPTPDAVAVKVLHPKVLWPAVRTDLTAIHAILISLRSYIRLRSVDDRQVSAIGLTMVFRITINTRKAQVGHDSMEKDGDQFWHVVR
jgi:hypothetical protein